MAIHRYRAATPRKPLRDPLSRQITQDFGQTILALRLAQRLPRLTVVERTGINWKRLRALEEGWQVAALDEVVRIAELYRVNGKRLLPNALNFGAER